MRLLVKIDNKFFPIKCGDITYVKTNNNYIIIKTTTITCETLCSLAAFLRQINYGDIIQVSKEFAINLDYVKHIDKKNSTVYVDDAFILIGKTFKNRLYGKYNSILNKQAYDKAQLLKKAKHDRVGKVK